MCDTICAVIMAVMWREFGLRTRTRSALPLVESCKHFTRYGRTKTHGTPNTVANVCTAGSPKLGNTETR